MSNEFVLVVCLIDVRILLISAWPGVAWAIELFVVNEVHVAEKLECLDIITSLNV